MKCFFANISTHDLYLRIEILGLAGIRDVERFVVTTARPRFVEEAEDKAPAIGRR
jgi:hypothetical protein